MRTVAYVDGYNLYFGRLKYTPYKWLDASRLLGEILRVQDPDTHLDCTKFYTASIKAKLARLGDASVQAQNAYHRALEATGGVELHCGKYSLESTYAVVYAEPPNKNDRVKVWRMEEKQTDVKIALHMYTDALRGNIDQIVLVTNDSDLVPALQMIRQDFPKVRVGVIFPLKPKSSVDEKLKRPPSQGLRDHAHWARDYIRDEELEACQLRTIVATRRKPIRKPGHW